MADNATITTAEEAQISGIVQAILDGDVQHAEERTNDFFSSPEDNAKRFKQLNDAINNIGHTNNHSNQKDNPQEQAKKAQQNRAIEAMFNATLQNLQNDLDRLKADLRNINERIDEINKQIEIIDLQVEELKVENKELEVKKAELIEDVKVIDEKIEDNNEKAKELEEKLDDKNKQIDKLEEKLKQKIEEVTQQLEHVRPDLADKYLQNVKPVEEQYVTISADLGTGMRSHILWQDEQGEYFIKDPYNGDPKYIGPEDTKLQHALAGALAIESHLLKEKVAQVGNADDEKAAAGFTESMNDFASKDEEQFVQEAFVDLNNINAHIENAVGIKVSLSTTQKEIAEQTALLERDKADILEKIAEIDEQLSLNQEKIKQLGLDRNQLSQQKEGLEKEAELKQQEIEKKQQEIKDNLEAIKKAEDDVTIHQKAMYSRVDQLGITIKELEEKLAEKEAQETTITNSMDSLKESYPDLTDRHDKLMGEYGDTTIAIKIWFADILPFVDSKLTLERALDFAEDNPDHKLTKAWKDVVKDDDDNIVFRANKDGSFYTMEDGVKKPISDADQIKKLSHEINDKVRMPGNESPFYAHLAAPEDDYEKTGDAILTAKTMNKANEDIQKDLNTEKENIEQQLENAKQQQNSQELTNQPSTPGFCVAPGFATSSPMPASRDKDAGTLASSFNTNAPMSTPEKPAPDSTIDVTKNTNTTQTSDPSNTNPLGQ